MTDAPRDRELNAQGGLNWLLEFNPGPTSHDAHCSGHAIAKEVLSCVMHRDDATAQVFRLLRAMFARMDEVESEGQRQEYELLVHQLYNVVIEICFWAQAYGDLLGGVDPPGSEKSTLLKASSGMFSIIYGSKR